MENKGAENVGIFTSFGDMVKEGLQKRKQDTTTVFYDAIVLLVAFVFSRCHILFGAYPLANAFVAVLPRGVWLALIGAVTGSLSLGRSGVIHAIISIIIVFLRVIISSGKTYRNLFGEPLVMRISAAVIGAFVGSAYEILLGGFAFAAVLYGVFSVILSAIFTFAFAGLFDSGISFSDVLLEKRNIFMRRKNEKERYSLYLFQATFLLFAFLISISLKGYSILGISPAYIFSAFITLIVARRFGPVRAMAVGFVSSFGISSVYSVAFALVGLASGLLFTVGTAYAFIGSGVLLAIWCFYSGGALGFLSTFPEYATAAMLSTPILRKLPTEEKIIEEKEATTAEAANMVATTALAYKNSQNSALTNLEGALLAVARSLHSLGEEETQLTPLEYRELVIDTVRGFCRECRGFQSCLNETPAPCIENIDLLADKLYKKERLFPDDSQIVPKYCHNSEELFRELEKRAGDLLGEKYKSRKIEAIADEYELFSKLISESVSYNERERAHNKFVSEKLVSVIEAAGLHEGVVKAFGERKKYFILAGEDRDGSILTSNELHKGIEECAGVRLGVPEYYRKGRIALFECASAPMYAVEFATAGKSAPGEEVSGDTAISFESEDGHFYSLIADGMGSGEAAHRTSHFTADFLSRILASACSKSTAFHILNHIIKNRSVECSSTVDLFDFDLITGEALFFKCGAAPSYIKRDSSIFRIRSETAPLGLMKNIDAEKIRPEVRGGDYIIMLSDGVSQTSEDSAWLLELLSAPVRFGIREYAELILSEAEKYSSSRDDMSVSVARIVKI